MITHLLHVPSQPVDAFVEHLWLVRGKMPPATRHVLLPDGAIVVIFNLGDPQALCDGNRARDRQVFRRSWVSGQQPRPITIDQSGYCHLVGIRFRPGGAFPLLRFSVAELTGRVLELEDIGGAEANGIRAELGDAPSDRAVLSRLERWLAAKFHRATAMDPRVVFAADQLRRGAPSVQRLTEQSGWSHKHFVHEFTRRVGVTPKLYGRIQRLQRAVQGIGLRPQVDWADTALTHGYYDQAHLIREFDQLAGISPTEFLRRRTPYPGYLIPALP